MDSFSQELGRSRYPGMTDALVLEGIFLQEKGLLPKNIAVPTNSVRIAVQDAFVNPDEAEEA